MALQEPRARRLFSSLALLAALGLSTRAVALPPARVSDPVPDPGKSVASDDDASAIAVNPANVAFLPAGELRWNTTWTGSASPLPNRGHSFEGAAPLFFLGTGLRVDAISPPSASPGPFVGDYHWIRWALAARAGQTAAIGTTFGWSNSSFRELDGMFSATTGATLRPFPFLSLAAVARDWNAPRSVSGFKDQRRYDLALAVRPLSVRAIEVGLEAELYERGAAIPRATIGLDVPRFGRVRGDIAMLDPAGGKDIAATAGLDLNLGALELSGGGVFGDVYSKNGSGFYAGAALRAYREPGVRFPSHVARIHIKDTPGVRGHVRLLKRLWRLADDPEIEGVLLVIKSEPSSSLAHAEELADAIRLLRVRGKKVMCHLEDAGGKALYACSQADRIAMNPAGGLRYAGAHGQYYYFGGLLKKFGVRADFVRIGAHKLAAEEITSSGGSQVAELDHQELIDQYQAIWIRAVSEGRHLSPEELSKRLAKGPFIAPEARAEGLVDVLAYEDEIDRAVQEMMGRKVAITDEESPTRAPESWGDADKIGVVYLHGDMVDGESQFIPFIDVRLAGSYTISRALKKMREDASVKAVVFRIETGGGSSLAADVILREATLLAKKKPLIVSMGTYAASGGYYAAASATEIFASPATVTGSIGIFYGKVDVVGLLDKFGVRSELFRATPRADAESFFRPFTDDERRVLGDKVKQFYDLFVGRVSEGRHMTPDAVDAVGRGKVWTGQQAVKRGLVDKLGGLREALAEARRLGHVSASAPFIELPDADDSVVAFLLKSAGLSSFMGQSQVMQAIVPPQFFSMARALSPFMVYDSNKPLARMEVMEDEARTGSGRSMSAPLLEATECRVAIGGVVALDRLTMISEGDCVLFAGDTTALFAALTTVPLGLRASRVARVADPEGTELTEAEVVAGSLTIEGKSVGSGAHLEITGAAALDPPLPPRWSVVEYVAWSARLGGASKGEARDLAGAALGKVGLERASKRRLETLTLPERRAIGIAQAAVLSPRVLVIEAPLVGLEGAGAAFVLAALGAATDGRRAIVSVARIDPASPEGALARGASHVTVLAGGGVAFDGAPANLFTSARHYTLLVADNAEGLRAELATRGIDLRGGPVRFSAALPAGTTTRDVLLAARAADAPLLEFVPLVL